MSSKTALTSALAARSSISGNAIVISPLYPPHLAGHTAGEEQRQHTKVAVERPDRVAKSLGPVVLEDAMPEPGAGIADDRRGNEKRPGARDGEGDQESDAGTAAEIMQRAGARVGMGPQITRPEFGVGHFRHPAATTGCL